MPVSVLSLSLSVATPSAVVYFEYSNNSSFIGSHLSHVLLFCFVFLKRYLFCCLWWVGLSLFFVAPSLAVFAYAPVFNQNLSTWNTGAVTTMNQSKCTLSPSLWPRLPLLCIFEYTTTRVSSDCNSHTFCYFCFCVFETVPFLLIVVGWSFFSLLYPLLQCLSTHVSSIRTCPNGIRVR